LTPAVVRNRVEIRRNEVIDVDRLRSHVAPFESNAPIRIIHRRGLQALALVTKSIDHTRVVVIACFSFMDERDVAFILRFVAYPVRARAVQGVAIDLALADINARAAGALRAEGACYSRVIGALTRTIRISRTRRRNFFVGAHTRRLIHASGSAASFLAVAKRPIIAIRKAAFEARRTIRVRRARRL